LLEHRSLSYNERLEAAAENLERTYASVGGAIPEAQIEQWPGMLVCVSGLPHPVANFAVVRSADPRTARQLRLLAQSRRVFNAYVLPGTDQAATARALQAAGWKAGGGLSLLEGGAPIGLPPAEFEPKTRTDDRLSVARQMGRMFFSRLADPVRETIAQATAGSMAELLAEAGKEPRGFALVSRIGSTFGIYSLCVRPDQRGQGIGSSMLEALLRTGKEEGRTAVLQCEAALVNWYERWGFRSLGRLNIFT